MAVSVNEKIVTVTIEGYGAINPTEQLANDLAAALERPVLLKLRIVPIQLGASISP